MNNMKNLLLEQKEEFKVSFERILNKVKNLIANKNYIIDKLSLEKKHLKQKISSKKNKFKLKNKYNFIKFSSKLFLEKSHKYKLFNNLINFDKNKNSKKEIVLNKDFEALKLIADELENKKNLLGEKTEEIFKLSTLNVSLNDELSKIKRELENVNIEKNNLKLSLEESKKTNDILYQQIKNLNEINENNLKYKDNYLNTRNDLNEKNKIHEIQQNTVITLTKNLEDKNDKLLELKKNFIELLNDFNDILLKVEEND